ncbi:MAG TPA: hypothetical protein VIK55_16920 [Paludibacter sp.]
MKIRIFTTILLLTSVSLFSQKQKFISVNASGLLATHSNFNLGFGFAYEEQILKHHGYEFGLNYRGRTTDGIITINNNNWNITVRENYLNLPISYKFYSDIVNFTTGISFDYFLGGDNLTEVPNVEFGRYDINPKLYVGWNFKIGKEINLTEKFILEPEIQYNPIFNYGYSFYGATIKLKYKL